jgi:DNA ligase-1
VYVKEACVESRVKSFVFDTEVVAFSHKAGQFVPLQVFSNSKKMEESSAKTAKVRVIMEAFDLIYLYGKSLLNMTFAEPHKLLYENFRLFDGNFQFARAVDHTEEGNTAVLEEFLETAMKSQCEGLMDTTLDVHAA